MNTTEHKHRQLAPFSRRYKWADLLEMSDIKLFGRLNIFSLVYARLGEMEEQFKKYDWSGMNERYNSTPAHLYKNTPQILDLKQFYKFMSQKTLFDLMKIAVIKNNIQLMKHIKDVYNFGKPYYGDNYFFEHLSTLLATYDSADILKYLIEEKVYTTYDLDCNSDLFIEKGSINILKYCNEIYRNMLAKKSVHQMAKSGDIEYFKSIKITKQMRERSIVIAAQNGKLELLEYLFDETGFDDEEMETHSLNKVLTHLSSTDHFSTFKYLVERYNFDLRPLRLRQNLELLFSEEKHQRFIAYIWDRESEFNIAEGKPTAKHIYECPESTIKQAECFELDVMIRNTMELDLFIYYYKLYGSFIKIDLGKSDYPLEIIHYIYENTRHRLTSFLPSNMIKRGWEELSFLLDKHPDHKNSTFLTTCARTDNLPILRKLLDNKIVLKNIFYSAIYFDTSLEVFKFLKQLVTTSVFRSYDSMKIAASKGKLSTIIYMIENYSDKSKYERRSLNLRHSYKQLNPDIVYFINHYYDPEDDDEDQVETEEEEQKEVKGQAKVTIPEKKTSGNKTKKEQTSDTDRLKRLKK